MHVVLSLRVATSGLYGEGDEQRLRALTAPEPAALPWIDSQLAALDRRALTHPRPRAEPRQPESSVAPC